uniref:Uncharacterized protein n=1 Tax=Tanacetum cinerariifolium TaxID=118510 RepID=A0A699GDT5_TANCI|nr:hypothetical protein [Tanacetum cinerariifolium]
MHQDFLELGDARAAVAARLQARRHLRHRLQVLLHDGVADGIAAHAKARAHGGTGVRALLHRRAHQQAHAVDLGQLFFGEQAGQPGARRQVLAWRDENALRDAVVHHVHGAVARPGAEVADGVAARQLVARKGLALDAGPVGHAVQIDLGAAEDETVPVDAELLDTHGRVLEFRLARHGIDHGVHQRSHAGIGRRLAIPVDRDEHAAARNPAAVLHPRHHGAPGGTDARQFALAHAVQQRVLRVDIDERFGDVIGQRVRLAGARHRMPLVAHAARIERERKILAHGIGRRPGGGGDEARLAIGMGEAAVGKQAHLAVQRAGGIAPDRPLHRLQSGVFGGRQTGQAGHVERARRIVGLVAKAAQARVFVEDGGGVREIEAVVTHALREPRNDLPVRQRLAGRRQKGALARDAALGIGDGAVLFSPPQRGQQHADQGIGGHDPHGFHFAGFDGLEQVHGFQAALVGHGRRVPERLHHVAVVGALEVHVRGQHIGQSPHFAPAHGVGLARDGKRSHARLPDPPADQMAVDDGVDLVGAAGRLVDAHRVHGDGFGRRCKRFIKLQQQLQIDAAGPRHRLRIGAIDVGRVQRRVEAARVLRQEGRIDRADARQVTEQAVEQPDVGARLDGQVQVGQLAGGRAARVDHDQLHLRARFLGLEDALEQDRMAPRGVRSHQHHHVGQFQVVVAQRHQVFAKGALVAGHGRRHAQARVGVDIGAADVPLHQLVGDVRFVPRHAPQAVGVTHLRVQQPAVQTHRLAQRRTLDAQAPLVRGMQHITGNGDRAVFARRGIDAAAHAAVGAGGPHGAGGKMVLGQGLPDRADVGAVLDQIEIPWTVLDVAIQHGARHAIVLQYQPLVDAAPRIAQQQVFAAVAAHEITDRVQVHAGDLQARGRGLLHVAPHAGAGQVGAAHARLVPDGRHQPERGAAMLHALAHGVDARIVRLQRIVHHDGAVAVQAGRLGQRDIGTHAGRHHHQVGRDGAAVLEAHAGHALDARDVGRMGVHQEGEAPVFQRLLQQQRGGLVELLVHQRVAHVHHGDRHALALQAAGGLQSQQAAADHHRVAVVARHGEHAFHVLDIAKRQHAGQLVARYGNDERLRAGGDQQAVVAHLQAGAGAHDAVLAVDMFDRVARVQGDAMLDVPFARVEHDVVHAFFTGQHGREQDAVVIAVRLGAEHGDVVQVRRQLVQLLDRAHARHAVADDDQRWPGGIEMLLVDRRRHHDAFSDAAHQSPRQHGRLRIGIVIGDGEYARSTVVHVEHGHLHAVQQCAHARGNGNGNHALALFHGGGADLAPFFHEQHVLVHLVAVDEMAEALAGLGIFDCFLPLARIGIDHVLHVRFEVRRDAQLVVHHNLLQVIEAAFQVVAPGAGALQAVAGAGIKHQEAVDVLHQRGLIEIGGQQFGVARLHAAVAGHVQVPALFGGDDAHVLALRFRAFARAAGHAELDLVRRAQPLVAVFQFDGEANRIIDAVPAPGGPHAGFDRAQRLAVGVARFETGRDQLFPDQGQLVHPGAKQVHPRAARDLGVQAVLLGHHAHGDQAIGRDLAARHARHHGIRAVLLDIAEEVVVGVLQAGVLFLQHEVVPHRRQDAGCQRLAYVATKAFAVFGQQVAEGLDLSHFDEMEQLLARVGEVFAHVVVDGHAEFFHFRLHHLRDQRHAAAARRAGVGAAFDVADGGRAAGHRRADRALGHIVARADLRAVGQRVHAQCRPGRAVRLRQDQEFGRCGQLYLVEHHLQQRAVFGGVAHHHAAQQVFAAVGHHDLLVDLFALVGELVRPAAGDSAVRVADAGHVHAHQFELGAHVGAGELARLAQHVSGRHARHLVARRHQAVDHAAPQRAFADRIHVRIGRDAVVIDLDAAARTDGQAALARQHVARADAGREHDHVGVQVAAVGKLHSVGAIDAIDDCRGVFARVDRHAQFLDLAAQHAGTAIVHLHGHQARRELHHVGVELQIAQRLGAFEAQQTAADHHAGFGARAAFEHRFQVFDGAIHEAVLAVLARQRRHERERAGGDHQLVVSEHVAVAGGHGFVCPVDGGGAGVQAQHHVGAIEESGLDQRQVLGGFTGKEFGQVHAVVGGTRLLAQHGDLQLAGDGRFFDGGAAEARGQCAQRGGRDHDAEDAERLLHVAHAFHQEARRHGAHVAAGADDAGHAAQCAPVDERHHGVRRAAGHVGEQAEDQHGANSQHGAAGVGKQQQAGALAQHQHEQQRDAVIEVAARGEFVGRPAAQGAGEQRQQAEAAGSHAGLAQRQVEMVDVIDGGDVVDEDLDAETGAVGDEQQPYAVVGSRQFKALPAALFSTPVDGDASGAQFAEVPLRAVLRVAVINERHDDHQHARHDQRRAPAQGFGDAQHDHGAHQERHHGLRHAAARIAPAGSCRVGRAHHLRREHDGRVVLGDDEAGAGRADPQPEEQEAFVALRKGDADDGDGAEQQQAGVRLAGTEMVAQRTDDQPHQDGNGDSGDVDVGDLRAREVELPFNHRHQRRAGKPREKTDEERHPGEVERPHWRRREGKKLDAVSFVGHGLSRSENKKAPAQPGPEIAVDLLMVGSARAVPEAWAMATEGESGEGRLAAVAWCDISVRGGDNGAERSDFGDCVLSAERVQRDVQARIQLPPIIGTPHHLAHHDNARATQAAGAQCFRQCAQGGEQLALVVARGRLHYRHRRCGRCAACQQARLDGVYPRHPHVDHQRQPALGQRLPVRLRRRILAVTRDERGALAPRAVRDRHADAGRRGQAAADAGDDIDLDALRAQGGALLAAATEQVRVAPFQPHHVVAGARFRHHQPLDERLRGGCAAAPLAHLYHARVRRRIVQHLRVHQVVDQQHVGAFDGAHGLDGEQFREFEHRRAVVHVARILRQRHAVARTLELHVDDLADGGGRAVGHHDDAVRQQHGFIDIVRDHHHGGPGGRNDLEQFVLQVGARQCIECAERFVHQQHLRFHGQRAGDAHPLLHAARDFVRALRFRRRQPHQCQSGHGALAQLRFRFRLAEHAFDAEMDVFVAGEPRQQRMVLEHHRALRRRSGDFAAGAQQHAVAGEQQPGDEVQQRRLAAARVADQGDEFSLAHGEGAGQRHQRLFQQQANEADGHDGDDDVRDVEVIPLVPHPEADAHAAGQHFGRHDHQPRGADRQPHARQHIRQRGRQQDLGQDLPLRQIEHARHVHVILRHALHADGGVDDHRPDRTDEDRPDRGRIGRLEDQQADGQPRQRRHGLEQADNRAEHGADELDAPDHEPQRDAHQRGQAEAHRDPLQRRQQIPADALVIGAVAVERIGKQFDGFVERHQRRGKSRVLDGDELPHQHQQGRAHQRGDDFHGGGRDLLARPRRGIGGQRPARTALGRFSDNDFSGGGGAIGLQHGVHGFPFKDDASANGLRFDLERRRKRFRIRAIPHRAVHQLRGAQRAFRHRRLGHRRSILVQVDLVDRLGHGQVVRVVLEQAPAAVLGHEPHAVGQVREVHLAVVVELHVVRIVPGLAQAVLVAAHDALVDRVLAGVDVRLVGDGLGHLVLVGQRRIDPFARIENGGHHGPARVRIFFGEVQRGPQHFFRVILPDVLGGGGRDANAVHDGAVAPRLAHAEAIHIADAHIGHHLRRRHGNDLGLLHRVDAVGGQPVVQPHGVGAGREGLRKRVFAFIGAHQPGQGGAIDGALVGQLFGQRDGLAVVVQSHQHGHVLLLAANAHLHAVQQAVQHVRGVEVAVGQLVAHARPRRFLAEHELDAVFLVKAQDGGHHHRRAVGQRNEADPDFFLLRLVRPRRPCPTCCQSQHASSCDQTCAMNDLPARDINRTATAHAHHFGRSSAQQIFNVEYALRHFRQFKVLAHGHAAQLLVRLLFGETLALHQQALGALDDLALGQLALGVGQLVQQLLLAFKTRQRDIEHRLDAVALQPRHDVGRHARRHGRLHAVGVVAFGKHDDGPRFVAGGNHDVFEHIARVRLGVDDDHVRLQLGDPVGQIHIGRQRGNDVVARLQQADAQHARAFHLRAQGLVVLIAGMDDGVDDNDAQAHPCPGCEAVHGMPMMSERRIAFDSGAIEFAAQVVGRAAGQVHQRAVIPEHQIVRRPAVAVHVLGQHAVGEQLGQQRAALVLGHADDAGGEMLAHEQRFATGLRVRAHDGVHHRLHFVDLRLAERRAPRAAAPQFLVLGQVAMLGAQALHRVTQRRRQGIPCQVGMPKVAGVAEADRLAVFDDIGDDQYFRRGWQLKIAQHVDLQRPETAAEIDLLLRRDALVAEHQQVVVEVRLVDAREIVRRQGLMQIEAEDLRAQRRIEQLDLEGSLENGRHGTPPKSVSRIVPRQRRGHARRQFGGARHRHAQFLQLAVLDAIHPAVYRQLLAAFPRVPHDGGLANVRDLFDYVQLHQALRAALFVDHGAHVALVLLRHVVHMAQPVVDQAHAGAGHGRVHALAAEVAHDDHVLHFQHIDGKLQHRQAVQVGMHDHVGDIAMDEHIARRQAQQFIGRYPAVRTADPQVLGGGLVGQAVEEIGIAFDFRGSPATVVLQQATQGGSAVFQVFHDVLSYIKRPPVHPEWAARRSDITGLGLRAVLVTAFGGRFLKLAQQVFLLVGQLDRRLHCHVAEQVAGKTGTHALDALAFQAEGLARLGAFRNRKRYFTRQCGHFDFAAQRRLGERDRHFAVQVVALALEHGVRLDVDFHVQVARRPAIGPRFAVAGRADAHAVVDADRDFHFQGLVALDAALARAGGARFRNDLAGAVALGAGLLDAEKALLHAHLAVTGAGGAGDGRRARLGAAAVTGVALVPRRHADGRVEAVGSLFQRDFEVVAQVGATVYLRTGAAATAGATAKDVAEDVAERIAETTGPAAEAATAIIRIDARVTVAVVRFALVRVGQHFVCFLDFLELFFRVFIVRITVRMVLHGQFTIGLLDFVFRRVFCDTECLVEITLSHCARNLAVFIFGTDYVKKPSRQRGSRSLGSAECW